MESSVLRRVGRIIFLGFNKHKEQKRGRGYCRVNAWRRGGEEAWHQQIEASLKGAPEDFWIFEIQVAERLSRIWRPHQQTCKDTVLHRGQY